MWKYDVSPTLEWSWIGLRSLTLLWKTQWIIFWVSYQANKCNVIPIKGFKVFFFFEDNEAQLWKGFQELKAHSFSWQWRFFYSTFERMGECDEWRAQKSPLNGGAIKVITLQTIKKGHESPGQLWLLPHFQSWAAFSLQPLCPGRSIWLGKRCRSCRRRSSRRRGCHQTWSARRSRWATTSHNGTRHQVTFSGRKEGRREVWFMQQRETKLVPLRAASLWNTLEGEVTPHDPNASSVSLAARVRATPLLWAYGALTWTGHRLLWLYYFSSTVACKAPSRENLNSLLLSLQMAANARLPSWSAHRFVISLFLSLTA